MTGSGSGIGGIADEFHFVFTEVNGAFTIRASEVFIDPGMGDFDNARAGLMIRDSLTPDSSYGYALIRVRISVCFHSGALRRRIRPRIWGV